MKRILNSTAFFVIGAVLGLVGLLNAGNGTPAEAIPPAVIAGAFIVGAAILAPPGPQGGS